MPPSRFNPYGFNMQVSRNAQQYDRNQQLAVRMTSSSQSLSSSVSRGRLEKAQLELCNVDKSGMSGMPPRRYIFQFNPEELSITRGVSTTEAGEDVGRDIKGYPRTSFSGPNLGTLDINNVVIDTLENGQDLLKDHIFYLKKMLELYTTGLGKKRTPIYHFIWGRTRYLTCFVSSITFNYKLFGTDGRPVRAEMNIKLKEIREQYHKSPSQAQ